MNLKRLETRVIQDEGYSSKPYRDSVGVLTIGYGTTRWIGREVMPADKVLPADARRFLRADLYGAILDAQKIFPRFEEMNSVRQEVLANMTYNLGPNRLAGFKKMIAALDDLDYKTAAREMIDAKWFKQVGGRGQRLVAAMRTGDWIT